ncbi:MAG: flagellar biosynthesis protein FlhB [Sphingobacteriia bacterium]|nr:flagellar biosynthesis protein FlhB [Sphingobacteriia bacterium]
MSEDDVDDSQKTEDPTPRRLEEAFKKGQVIYSREVTNFFVFLCLIAIVWKGIPIMGEKTYLNFGYYFLNSDQIQINDSVLMKIYKDSSLYFLLLIIVPCSLTIIASILSSFIQNGRFSYSGEPLIPKLEKISILKGLGRLFSLKSVVEFLKGLIKIIVIGVASYLTISHSINKVKIIHDYEIISIISFIHKLAKDVLIVVCSILFVIAILDYLYQRYEFYKELKMSRQEIKDEYKETEGSPEIKAKIKKMRAERAKKRMMANVPKADVIITNPTHFAVALQYDKSEMTAPIVVAKGTDKVALRIREIANKHEVPIVENPFLARELYKLVDIEEEVPFEHYQAVAEIISYVYKLKGKTME